MDATRVRGISSMAAEVRGRRGGAAVCFGHRQRSGLSSGPDLSALEGTRGFLEGELGIVEGCVWFKDWKPEGGPTKLELHGKGHGEWSENRGYVRSF